MSVFLTIRKGNLAQLHLVLYYFRFFVLNKNATVLVRSFYRMTIKVLTSNHTQKKINRAYAIFYTKIGLKPLKT